MGPIVNFSPSRPITLTGQQLTTTRSLGATTGNPTLISQIPSILDGVSRLYLATASIVVTLFTAGTISAGIQFTDENGNPHSPILVTGTAVGYFPGSTMLLLNKNSVINFTTTGAGWTGTYDVFGSIFLIG